MFSKQKIKKLTGLTGPRYVTIVYVILVKHKHSFSLIMSIFKVSLQVIFETDNQS